MKLSGAATMQANPEAVYAAFNDPRCWPDACRAARSSPRSGRATTR